MEFTKPASEDKIAISIDLKGPLFETNGGPPTMTIEAAKTEDKVVLSIELQNCPITKKALYKNCDNIGNISINRDDKSIGLN
jgi:hypothetical protein